MLAEETVREYAVRLDQAEQARVQIDALSMSEPEIALENAYRIQSAWMEQKLLRRCVSIGKNIGLIARVMQQAMKIDQPDFSILLDNMVIANQGTFAAKDYTDPSLR